MNSPPQKPVTPLVIYLHSKGWSAAAVARELGYPNDRRLRLWAHDTRKLERIAALVGGTLEEMAAFKVLATDVRTPEYLRRENLPPNMLTLLSELTGHDKAHVSRVLGRTYNRPQIVAQLDAAFKRLQGVRVKPSARVKALLEAE